MSTNFSEKDISQITTYQSGVAQASALRITNRIVSDYLTRYDLTATQWFVVGLIYDAKSAGMRLSDLNRKLGTTLPYITNTINLLESKNIVQKKSHSNDSRTKLVSIVPSYVSTVEEIETGLRAHLRDTLYSQDRITRQELTDYIHVLYKIVHK